MSDYQNNFSKLKYNLSILNQKNKNNKIRVSESCLITSSYLSHVIPSSIGKLILAPFTRLSLMQQVGLNNNNNIFNNGWKGVHLHISVGLIYPAIKSLIKRSDSYINNKKSVENSFLRELISTTFGFSIAYPFEVAYAYIASSSNRISIKTYIKDIYNSQGISGIYKGCSFGLFATFQYTAIATLINNNLQEMIKSRAEIPSLNIDNDKNTIAKDLHPVSFYPWNILAGSISSMIALGVTYPIDTIRRRYIVGCNGCDTPINSIKNTIKSGFSSTYRGFPVRFLIYLPYTLIYIFTYKPTIHIIS